MPARDYNTIFAHECSFIVDKKCCHESGYRPAELICRHWEISPITGMADTREMKDSVKKDHRRLTFHPHFRSTRNQI